jgi:hypothetical protein
MSIRACSEILLINSHYRTQENVHLSRHEIEEEAHWKSLSTTDKIMDWTQRHQYSFIMGGWALGLAVSGSIIWKDRCVQIVSMATASMLTAPRILRYQTPAQKVVQIRMWAQGITIGLLIAGGALNAAQRNKSGGSQVCYHPK